MPTFKRKLHCIKCKETKSTNEFPVDLKNICRKYKWVFKLNYKIVNTYEVLNAKNRSYK